MALDIENHGGDLEKVKIKDFYPHIKLDNVKYCVILNHSCSLSIEHKPICTSPYINIGFLEPIEVLLKKKFTTYFGDQCYIELEKDISLQEGKDKICFYNEDEFKKRLKKSLYEIFQNNDPWYFFVALGSKSPELFVINLLKTVPIKSVHYDSFFKEIKYQLKEEFADSLGWKIAELYGKMGTTDYTEKESSSLIDKLLEVINTKILNDKSVFKVDKATLSEVKGYKSSAEQRVINFLIDKQLIEAKK